jgi:hypothetical protein
MIPRFLLRISLLSAVTVLAGCGSGPPYGEVEGTLTMDDKPLDGIRITFSPEPNAGSQGPGSYATTDGDGHYQLASLNPARAGALVGKHRVLLADGQRAPPENKRPGVRPQAHGLARIPAKYGPLSPTSLVVEVRDGRQTIDLRLTSKP